MMAVMIRREGPSVCVIGGTQVALPAEVLDELLGKWFRDYVGREHALAALPPTGTAYARRYPLLPPGAKVEECGRPFGEPWDLPGERSRLPRGHWLCRCMRCVGVLEEQERVAGKRRLAVGAAPKPQPTAERLVWPEKARQVAGCRSPSYERHVCGACGCSVAEDRKACPECGRTFRGDKMMGQEGLVSQGRDAVICSPCAYAHVPQSACKCLDCGRTVRGDKMMGQEGGEDG